MQEFLAISPIYKWFVYWGYNALNLTFDSKFQRDIQVLESYIYINGSVQCCWYQNHTPIRICLQIYPGHGNTGRWEDISFVNEHQGQCCKPKLVWSKACQGVPICTATALCLSRSFHSSQQCLTRQRVSSNFRRGQKEAILEVLNQ